MRKLFTSEQVANGHPDKICDQIADAVLDYCLERDPYSRVACEVFGKNYTIVVGGEITTKANVTPVVINDIVRSTLNGIGVDDADRYSIIDLLDKQSSDIAMGVDVGGAGDQGLMFGYACDETKECMPLAWTLATEALLKLKDRKGDILLPDAKSQVTIDYGNNMPRIDAFLISTQHRDYASQNDVRSIVVPIMEEVAKEHGLNTDFKVLVNPTGRFVIGGFVGDAGVTGRKIIADTYGGYARHGGGAFSGKDPTKVDRSAAYMARWIAKNIVARGMAKQCEVQLAYAIGIKEPVSVSVEAFGTNTLPIDKIQDLIIKNVDLTPDGIIRKFDLRQPVYSHTSAYGHFGKIVLPWEKLDLNF